jgi:hypothetical protein
LEFRQVHHHRTAFAGAGAPAAANDGEIVVIVIDGKG